MREKENDGITPEPSPWGSFERPEARKIGNV
jgi:hypothetical protein